jgi:hypothetical protein
MASLKKIIASIAMALGAHMVSVSKKIIFAEHVISV